MSNTLATIPSAGDMLSRALESVQRGDVTPQSVEVLKGMMDLYERTQKREDQRAFASALTALQGETVRVVATKPVDPKSDGTCRYRFAPYEEIMAKVQPMLTRHGFSITFDTEVGDARLTCICTLTHSSGESRQNRFAVRYGKPPGSSDAQGDMSTKSYAKRGALCDALNIVIDHDDNAQADGDFVTKEEAEFLRQRVRALKSSEAKFLAFAGGAPTFEEIGRSKLPQINEMLARKEAKADSPEKGDPAKEEKF